MRIFFIMLFMLLLVGCANRSIVKAPGSSATAVVALTPPTYVVPSSIAVVDASMPIAAKATTPDLDSRQVNCLADAMYYEARGESQRGQTAVAYVVVNRTASGKFPPSICGVVHQSVMARGHPALHRCQFGWYCDGIRHRVVDAKAYAHAQDLARLVMLGVAPNPIGRCLYFHNVAEHTRPVRRYAFHQRIEHHIFFAYVDKVAAG